MKIMVAYDGTMQAKEALVYGMDKAREKGGEVVALHVFNNGLFIDYDANVEAESLARREAAGFVEEAKALIRDKGKGVRASLFTADGNPEEEVMRFAQENKVDALLCPPRFRSIITKHQKALAEARLTDVTGDNNLLLLSTKTM